MGRWYASLKNKNEWNVVIIGEEETYLFFIFHFFF